MMHCNIPQAGLRGRHLCVSVTKYPSLNKHLCSPPFNYIYETKRHYLIERTYPFLEVCSPLVVFSYDYFNPGLPTLALCSLQKREGEDNVGTRRGKQT